jgi:hypothetical protein
VARRKYPVPKPVKFDEKLIKEEFVYGTTKFGLTDKHIMMYHKLFANWSKLYDGRYNDLEQRWKSICTL